MNQNIKSCYFQENQKKIYSNCFIQIVAKKYNKISNAKKVHFSFTVDVFFIKISFHQRTVKQMKFSQ